MAIAMKRATRSILQGATPSCSQMRFKADTGRPVGDERTNADFSWINNKSPRHQRSYYGNENVLPMVKSKSADPYAFRNFHYSLNVFNRSLMLSGARAYAALALSTLTQSAKLEALGNIEIDIGFINKGQTVTVEWRGKPIFIRYRTQEEIDAARETPLNKLRDPQTDQERCQDPNYFIGIGICTHLGCVPMANSGDWKGYYCPCHGSHYDQSGRIRKGPAPLNLAIPPHKHLPGKTVFIGDLDKLSG